MYSTLKREPTSHPNQAGTVYLYHLCVVTLGERSGFTVEGFHALAVL